MRRSARLLTLLAAVTAPALSGCSLLIPEIAHQPVIRNPFPQLRRVAVAPFFNQSDESTVDGRQVALSYFAELQSTPGFEVVPVGVVEEAILAHQVDLSNPGEARRLAQLLEVDAVAVGSITDFSEYYPPRLGLRVEWYAANPGFHEIPAGYGLPWNTPEEEFIPDALAYESQMAAARAQMASLTPDCDQGCQVLPAPPAPGAGADDEPLTLEPLLPPAPHELKPPTPEAAPQDEKSQTDSQDGEPTEPAASPPQARGVRPAAAPVFVRSGGPKSNRRDAAGAARGAVVAASATATIGAADCAAGGPAGETALATDCLPQHGPVLVHTKLYRGNDSDVAEALAGYVSFREDQRFGGWKSYLARSDDFIRFCCHMHISEMLSARGGSRETQVVWRWPESR